MDLNVVVNTAGIKLPENLSDQGHLQIAEDTVTTNLLGPIRLLAEVVPFLAAKDDAVIVNVSAGLAFVPRGTPLPAFLDEVMDLLRSNPDAPEVSVQDVLFIHNAEAEGKRDGVPAMLSGAH